MASNLLLSSPQRRPWGGHSNGNKRERIAISTSITTNNKRFKTTGEEGEEADNAEPFNLQPMRCKGGIHTNDEVHEDIELCPVSMTLVDTEVFQRLKEIKQLGAAEYLYACANHTRFQHSLGVYHLAKTMATNLQTKQPQFGVTPKDILCVSLAGLLHDVGHGPFSHIYETFRSQTLPTFLKQYPHLNKNYDGFDLVPKEWCHELSSLQMVDAALAELGLAIDLDHLDEPLKQIDNNKGIDAKTMRVFLPGNNKQDILTSRDWVFVKECILGKPLPEVQDRFGEIFIGRQDATKEWLYDIVNNRHSGLDVDKMDYFARDWKRCKGESNKDTKMVTDAWIAPGECPNPDKCFKCKYATKPEDRIHYMICYPKKRVKVVWDFFSRRFYNHENIYQNKKTSAVEGLLCDILALADPFFRLKSHDGEEFPISRAVLKSDFLKRLDDGVIKLIEHSSPKEYPQPEMATARHLIRCLRNHQIYKCAVDEEDAFLDLDEPHHRAINDMCRDNVQAIADGMMKEYRYWKRQRNPGEPPLPELSTKDFLIKHYCVHYGRKDQNPLLCVGFLLNSMNGKLTGPVEEIPKAFQANLKKLRANIPCEFMQTGLRVFSRRPEQHYLDLISQLFHQWFERMADEYGASDDEQGRAVKQTPAPSFKLEQLDDSDDDDNNNDDDDLSDHRKPPPVMLSQDDDEIPDYASAAPTQSPCVLQSR